MDGGKGEDFEFSSESPVYDFSAGFDSMPHMTYMSDQESSYYSPTSSMASSPRDSMSIDGNYPPPAQLPANHRNTRYLGPTQWSTVDPSQRTVLSPTARPYGLPVCRQTGQSFCRFYTSQTCP